MLLIVVVGLVHRCQRYVELGVFFEVLRTASFKQAIILSFCCDLCDCIYIPNHLLNFVILFIFQCNRSHKFCWMSVCCSNGSRVSVVPLALSIRILKTSIQYSAVYSNNWLLLPWRRYILDTGLMVVIHRLIAFRSLWSLFPNRNRHSPANFSLDISTLLWWLKKALLRRLPFSLARIRRVFGQVTSASRVATSTK